MQIKKVSYSALVNLGDYQNERIGMVADLEEGDSPEQVIEALRERTQPLKGASANALDTRRYKLQSEVRELERKLSDYQNRWNQAAEFLRAQGLKPDAPDFPPFGNLLNAAPEVDAEFVEDEYDEDEDDN